MGAYFMTLNRSKESVCIDLKSDAGRAVFYDLVRHADVVFDNFGAGVPQRLKIDHATLARSTRGSSPARSPASARPAPTRSGRRSTRSSRAWAAGMSITGRPDDAPVRGGIPIGDLGGGIFGAMGVLAALQARHVTGVGQHVDVSMLDAQISLLTYMATMHLMSGHIPGRIGNSHFVHVPYNTFTTSDGHIIIACIGDAFYERFLNVVPHPELMKPEYLKQPVRYAAREKIDAIINEELGKNTSAYWLDKLRAARIPCGPVNDFAQALSDPQILARDMVVDGAAARRDERADAGHPDEVLGRADAGVQRAADARPRHAHGARRPARLRRGEDRRVARGSRDPVVERVREPVFAAESHAMQSPQRRRSADRPERAIASSSAVSYPTLASALRECSPSAGRTGPDRAGLVLELDRDAEVGLPVGELDAHLARLQVVAAHRLGEALDRAPSSSRCRRRSAPTRRAGG
jgi:crotonobetainyl-CoA:carnitine CoA-transferase CaiB-like acyl-CoA transferase